MKTAPELVADKLIAGASKTGRDIPVFFQDFLTWLIDAFSVQKLIEHNADYANLFAQLANNNELFHSCLIDWVKYTDSQLAKHKCVDFFGEVYEWCFQSKSKAARMGQYFTPYSIGKLMADILRDNTIEHGGVTYCSEPSCGSGRNLLAVWESADWNKRYTFFAEDLDPVSVKMCALNMMMNGMFGYVICHNSLFPDDFIFGYAVNEVRNPFPSNYFSVRQISADEYKQINPWPSIAEANAEAGDKPIKQARQLTLF